MVDACRIFARINAFDALIALIRNDGNERILVSIRTVLPRTDLHHDNTALIVGVAMLNPTRHLARMATSTEVVVDKDSLSPHDYRSPSDSL